MKWPLLSLGLSASMGQATPMQREEGISIYSLRISSRLQDEPPEWPGGTKSLDGRQLSLKGSNLGVYNMDTPPVQFYTIPSNKSSGLLELHTYPIGFVDHALAVVGSQGLLVFRDITNPAATSIPVGTILDYSSFSFGEKPATNDTSANVLRYASGSRRGKWVAFPQNGGDWTVMWRDESAMTTMNYLPIDLIYEPVTTQDNGEGGVN